MLRLLPKFIIPILMAIGLIHFSATRAINANHLVLGIVLTFIVTMWVIGSVLREGAQHGK